MALVCSPWSEGALASGDIWCAWGARSTRDSDTAMRATAIGWVDYPTLVDNVTRVVRG